MNKNNRATAADLNTPVPEDRNDDDEEELSLSDSETELEDGELAGSSQVESPVPSSSASGIKFNWKANKNRPFKRSYFDHDFEAKLGSGD